jgi:hypothetical protein
MCMSDDENDNATCYDAPAASAVVGAGGAPAAAVAAGAKKTKNKICPKCLFFWVVVLGLIIGVMVYRKRA